MGPIFGRNFLKGQKRPGGWVAGWREIGGKKCYFRSRWEYNYAAYLQFLKQRGLIIEWQHEKKTFWFEKTKRGTRSYLPDFIVTCLVGEDEVHEVKGYMDARSATKLKRMQIYYPLVKVVVIGEKWFRENAKKLMYIVPGWEVGNKKRY